MSRSAGTNRSRRPLERPDVDRQLLQVGERVLQQRVREGEAGRQLLDEDLVADLGAFRQGGRHGEEADPLAGASSVFPYE